MRPSPRRGRSPRLSAPLQTAQFAIVNHEPVERGAAIGVVEGRGTGAERGDLFLVAEGTTPAGNEFAGHLVSRAGRSWKTLDLSLTGSLLRLFEEAQRSLREWNERSVAQHRVGMGMSCLALRGGRAVLALRGPARVLHVSGATVTSHEPEEAEAAPMNGTGPAPPRLVSLPVAPGDRLLLATTNVSEALDEELMGSILALSLSEILPDLYRRLTHLRDAAVLLVALPGEDELGLMPPAPDPAPVPGDEAAPADGPVIGARPEAPAAFQSSLFVEDGAGAASVELARRRLEALDARSRVAPPEAEAAPLRRAVGDEGALPPTPRARRDAGGNDGAFFPAIAPPRPPPAPESHRTDTAPVSELAAGRRGQLAASTGWRPPAASGPAPRGAGGAPLVRVRSSMGGGPRRGGGTLAASGGRGFPTLSRLALLLGLALLAGVVAWLAIPRVADRDAGAANLAALLDEARSSAAAAAAIDDPDARRQALTRARALLLEAGALEGGGEAAAALLPRVERGLAELDAVAAPAAIETIADLRGFGDAPLAVSRMAAGDTHVWLLDEAGGRVVAVALATGAKEVVFAAGEDGAGAPVAIAFADGTRPGGPALLVADANGALWARTAETLERLAFARPDGLAVTDLWFADGALYALDAPAAAIHRFAAGPDGFGTAPATALRSPELAHARRLTVDGGAIFTASGDGAVRRFSGELTLELSQAGIDRPLRAAARPWTDGPAGELAFLDASADRIVVLGRDGAFARQYRHEELRDLTAFATRAGYGYAFSGERLRRVTFQP